MILLPEPSPMPPERLLPPPLPYRGERLWRADRGADVVEGLCSSVSRPSYP